VTADKPLQSSHVAVVIRRRLKTNIVHSILDACIIHGNVALESLNYVDSDSHIYTALCVGGVTVPNSYITEQ
jgi:hypothetical protein